MLAFWQSFVFVSLAEMGDKSQLVALVFATRFAASLVLGAILAATLVVHLLAVALGEVAGAAFPERWVHVGAGVAFIGSGLWTLRGDTLDGEDGGTSVSRRFGPFLTVAITFFLAELGDKTMLTTVTLASQQAAFVPVWLGSSLGMVAADGLAILVGTVAGRRLPERLIRIGAALVFIATGLLTAGQALIG